LKRELAEFIVSACENNDVLFSDKGQELPKLKEGYRGKFTREEATAIQIDDIAPIMAAMFGEAMEGDTDDLQWTVKDIADLRIDTLGFELILY
jgi:hypothetical protein